MAVPHEQPQGLQSKSFGTFLRSVPKARNLDEETKQVVLRLGRKLQTLSDYRDKHVEHVSPSELAGLLTDEAGARRTHYKAGKVKNDAPARDATPGGQTWVRIDATAGGYAYMVHIDVQLPEGSIPVKKGDPIGRTSDGGSGHFQRHGPHGHFFKSPEIKSDSRDVFQYEEWVGESPEPVAAFAEVTSYCREVLEHLAKGI
jgi:hypothetical protein